MPGWTRGQKITKDESRQYRDNKSKNKNKNKNQNKNYRADNRHQQQVQRLEPLVLTSQRPQIIVPIDKTLTENFTPETKWKGIVLNEIDNDMKFEPVGVDELDPKYWIDEHIWAGPRMIKSMKPNRISHKSSFHNVCGKTLYSRNGRDWYPSWKATFTHQQWALQNQALIDRRCRKLQEKYAFKDEMLRIQSERYMEETGDMDDYAVIQKWHDDFDKHNEELMNKMERQQISDDEEDEWN